MNLAVYPSMLPTVLPSSKQHSLSSSRIKDSAALPELAKDPLNSLLTNVFRVNAFASFARQFKLNELPDIVDFSIPHFVQKKSQENLEVGKAGKEDQNKNIINQAFSNLKHKTNIGVRLEARGRLTRRFTASRSVFKLK